jgi:hypothetical protein
MLTSHSLSIISILYLRFALFQSITTTTNSYIVDNIHSRASSNGHLNGLKHETNSTVNEKVIVGDDLHRKEHPENYFDQVSSNVEASMRLIQVLSTGQRELSSDVLKTSKAFQPSSIRSTDDDDFISKLSTRPSFDMSSGQRDSTNHDNTHATMVNITSTTKMDTLHASETSYTSSNQTSMLI